MDITDNVTFEYQSGIMKAYICGDIDHHSAKALRAAMDERLYSDRPAVFALNMSQVSFMDSSGLGLILGRFTLCRDLGSEFVLESPSREVEKILELAGTGRLIKVVKSEKKK